ncbi:MAG: hypothetical protein CM1200mP39_12080 [Dehalococcoidia bacterium]|nr:MAG: hypothetical protein CM1200mP39_12080 [Dehalococcoidia bacterium]
MNDEVQVRVLSASSGAVNESDILLASASDAMVMGFETTVEAGARRQSRQKVLRYVLMTLSTILLMK